jgi:heme-degrading monooxygenase HmoA
MIVRVFEARLLPGAEEAFDTALSDDIAAARSQPGLVSIQWGRRITDGEVEVIVLSEWENLEFVQAWLGHGYLVPRYAPGEAALVREASVRHYEGVEA